MRGSFLPARLESLFLCVRWLEDAPERSGCGGGGGGGRVGSGAGLERRRRRRREGPDGVNSSGGGGGRAPEGEAAAEAVSRLGRKPGAAGGCAAGEPARPRLPPSPQVRPLCEWGTAVSPACSLSTGLGPDPGHRLRSRSRLWGARRGSSLPARVEVRCFLSRPSMQAAPMGARATPGRGSPSPARRAGKHHLSALLSGSLSALPCALLYFLTSTLNQLPTSIYLLYVLFPPLREIQTQEYWRGVCASLEEAQEVANH